MAYRAVTDPRIVALRQLIATEPALLVALLATFRQRYDLGERSLDPVCAQLASLTREEKPRRPRRVSSACWRRWRRSAPASWLTGASSRTSSGRSSNAPFRSILADVNVVVDGDVVGARSVEDASMPLALWAPSSWGRLRARRSR
jgi:hypothetical protein